MRLNYVYQFLDFYGPDRVAQSEVRLTEESEVPDSDTRSGTYFREIDHEIS